MTQNEITSQPGVYALILHAIESQVISAGRLGSQTIKPGWYTYIGSAHGSGGLKSRIGRHLRREKNPHWHVDYLLPRVVLHEIWFAQATPQIEHRWVTAFASLTGSSIPIPGFGSSDCKAGCAAHLVKVPSQPNDDLVTRLELDAVNGRIKLQKIIPTET